MKKTQTIIFILLLTTLGALWNLEHPQKMAPIKKPRRTVVQSPVDVVQAQKQAILATQTKTPEGAPLKITFFNIGQGDSTFIEFPNGEKMLVDCSMDQRILPKLGKAMHFYDNTIDYLVATHPDADHYGGCIDVLKRFTVKHILFNGYKKDRSGLFNWFWESVQKEVTDEQAEYHQIKAPETFIIASTTIRVLYPDHDVSIDPLIPGVSNKSESNGTSIVMKFTYGKEKILMTGDLEADLEGYLLKKYSTSTFDVDVLKVGHHGSPGASSEPFLEAVTPKHATISVGANNSYGHPSLRVIKRLQRLGSTIWRTDELGDIMVNVYPEDITVKTEKSL